MKVPEKPATLAEILRDMQRTGKAQRLAEVLFGSRVSPAPEGRYFHLDELRWRPPPQELSVDEWWAGIKFARSQLRRETPLRDKEGAPFSYALADPVLELLHEIDRDASGPIATTEPITNPQTRDRYIQSSVIEEAITSSQLEGAATTREVAKDMIRSGRKPSDRSERMILNNYRAIQLVARLIDQPLSPKLIDRLHRTITEGTLPANGRHRRQADDGIGVYDERDNVLLHDPPHASETPARMKAMCDFANRAETGVFLHPVIKAIILHFWMAYDHPYVDGNGRTARALFYWSVLRSGFWLFEFVSISRILRKAPSKYARSFLYTETDENDLTYFIINQLQVIRTAIKDLHLFLSAKTKEIQETEQLLRASAAVNNRQLALLGHALRHPGMLYTIQSHKISQGVTYQTARSDLLDLGKRQLLVQTKRGKKFMFEAPDDLYRRLRKRS